MLQNVNSCLPLVSFQVDPVCRMTSAETIVTPVKQSPFILTLRDLSFRNFWRPEFVQPMTNTRLGTGRRFRYACSQQLASVLCTPSGGRPHTREGAFVEASSIPRLAMSAIGEMEWAI
jgi:hypothetical protein